jgi:predicted PurR-regulated permease PerM
MKMPFTDPHPFFQNWRASKVALATVYVVSVGAFFWLLFRFKMVLFTLFFAILLSTAITPGVFWLHRRGMPRAPGVILIYLLILAVVVSFFWLIAPLILDQVIAIIEQLPGYYQQLRSWFSDSPSFLVRLIGTRLPQELITMPISQPANIVDPGKVTSQENGADVAVLEQIANAIWFAATLLRGLFMGLAVILLAFYWTLDGDRTIRYLLLLVPQNYRENVRGIYEDAELKVGNYLRGLFLLSLAVGAMALLAYWIIGLPYAFSLALVAGVFEAVPIVGPALGAIPAILIALSTGQDSLVVGVIIAVLVIQAVENYILGPRILGRSVGVNPLVTLLALVTFTSLLGFAGALLAIPLAAIFQLILDRFILKLDALEDIIPHGRDRVSVLRAELQELSSDVRKQIRQKVEETGEIEDQMEDSLEKLASDLDQLLLDISQPVSSEQGDFS